MFAKHFEKDPFSYGGWGPEHWGAPTLKSLDFKETVYKSSKNENK